MKAPVPAPSLTGEAACFYSRQVQDFRILDRSNLIVYAPNDRHAYHVRISPPSIDLTHADALAFTGDRICGYAGDRLIIGSPGPTRRFSVIDVSRLSPEGLETLQAGGSGIPAPEPQPGPGAEIEGVSEPSPDPESAGKADSTAER